MDLNLVRAGVVSHPEKWAHGGYREIQNPPKRYRIIDTSMLMKYCDVVSLEAFQNLHRNWIEDELQLAPLRMEAQWTQSIAFGSKSFVDQVYKALGVKIKHRNIIEDGSSFCIKESYPPYNAHFAIKMDLLRAQNTIRWDG
jgi:putative transposase